MIRIQSNLCRLGHMYNNISQDIIDAKTTDGSNYNPETRKNMTLKELMRELICSASMKLVRYDLYIR